MKTLALAFALTLSACGGQVAGPAPADGCTEIADPVQAGPCMEHELQCPDGVHAYAERDGQRVEVSDTIAGGQAYSGLCADASDPAAHYARMWCECNGHNDSQTACTARLTDIVRAQKWDVACTEFYAAAIELAECGATALPSCTLGVAQ